MAAAATTKKKEAAAASTTARAPMPVRAQVSGGLLLLGLPPDAREEDIEYVLGDVQRTLSVLDSKRLTLHNQIAAASRGKRRAPPPRSAPPPPAAAAPAVPAVVVGVPVLPDPGARYNTYTREGAGAVRRRLRAAAGDVKKERKRRRPRGAIWRRRWWTPGRGSPWSPQENEPHID